ncbi:hypothetical protein P152DRAFT_435136 [Eremomyces bilateralis CBS 781.70]|uniref:NAD(P)-binding protein n=1 Tax=Eremomyces bilateralis CBS 781.70 TaxID=1392243 RepID=A0A6G1G4P2_9PEZI|nr:uncharacterized protein P152DRAFT_435136 [Eremomyces bilateralis CBS 781.70]KAF1812880.1 hypothetical protein P152DRAFT_435136 [Eremomyces bilateralis CBS 781.70]
MAGNGESSTKVALITGGASGMGLATVKRLVELGWNVSVLDYNKATGEAVAKELGDQVQFFHVDTANYDQHAKAFETTWKKFHRLDFVWQNAGIGDRIDFYAPVEAADDAPPPKPNIDVMTVCLDAMVYGAYLALHYFRKNPSKGGKLLFTSSMCGLFPGTGIPLYTAAKHGVVGLTRALSAQLAKRNEPITVNCLCPGLVDTGLTPALMAAAPTNVVTPPSTIVRAVEEVLNEEGLTGMALECSVQNIHRRTQQEYGDENTAFLFGDYFVTALDRETLKARAPK